MIITVKGNQSEHHPSMLAKTKKYVKNKLKIEKVKVIDSVIDDINKLSLFFTEENLAIILYDVSWVNIPLQNKISHIIKNKPDNITILLLVDRDRCNTTYNPLLKCSTDEIDIDLEDY